jgi:mycoredoxin
VPDEVIVYYRPGCPFAAKLRTKLKLARIPYRAIRFGEDAGADEAARSVSDGNQISPAVRVGGQYLVNPPVHEIRKALTES